MSSLNPNRSLEIRPTRFSNDRFGFKETIQWLKDNCRTLTNSVLILNGNHNTSVTPQDAIDFYQQTGAKDKSLRIYSGVNHFLMNDPKGKMIANDVISWIEDRLGNEVYEDAGI